MPTDLMNAPTVDSRTGEASRVLADRVRAVLAAANGDASPRIVQVAVPVEGGEPLAWLRTHSSAPGPKGFWATRTGDTSAAFWGAADVQAGARPDVLDEIEALDTMEAQAQVRYYGGMRFDPGASPDEVWAPFGAVRFVLPRVELRTDPAKSEDRLLCHLKLPRDAACADAVLAEIEQHAGPTPPAPGPLPRPLARVNRPGREEWQQIAGAMLQAIRSGALDKVVLARRADFTFDAPLDAPALMARLHSAAPDGFHFLLVAEDESAFLGASPERLFRTEGRTVWSEAVAGTRERGASPRADRRLRRELLDSAKERREHAMVASYVRERLAALCTEVEGDGAPQVLRLARAQHLHTRLRGMLRRGVPAAQVVRALHPTPAVNGVPTEAARRTLRGREPFDRGWYAGPVGWVGPYGAELAVGLRSGLVRGTALHLFSGAGLVEGSEPAREWAEVEQKIGDFVDALDM